MDFAFTAEQGAVRDTAARFARERLAPRYRAREQERRIERDLIRDMGALGLIGADLPAALGGPGMDSVSSGIVMEEISRADMNVGYLQILGSLMGSVIATHASPGIAADMVARIASGEAVVALGMTEPGAGSDAGHLQMKARADGSDWRLDGEKTSISMADQADWIVVLARTDPANPGAGGISAFLVPLDAPGITRSAFDDVGSRAVGRGSIFFDSVRVPGSRMIGAPGQGFRQVLQGFDYSRALIGLQCLAAAAASLEESWEYVKVRHAFGQRLAGFQGVTEPLAEAETLLMAARLLCYRTLWLRDNGLPHTAEAAMCKWWAPKTAFEVIHRCLLTHGQNGYSAELPHQQRLRDVMGLQIGDGTEQIQKMIIAREKVGRMALPYA